MVDFSAFKYDDWSAPSLDRRSDADLPASAEDGAYGGAGSELVPAGLPEAQGFAAEDFGEGAASAGGGAASGQDFASIKFLRENTLLSNAENYAASIQEEAELYVSQIRKEVEELNREAELRYEEARKVKEEAEQETERTIDSAQEHVGEIREQARQEGFEAGKEAGMQARYEEAAPYLEHIEAILLELEQFRTQVAYYAEKDSIRLAVLMAKKVLMQELKLNKKAIWNLLAKTLSTMEGHGQFRIWLNPEDYQFAQTARPSLERFVDEDQALTFRAKPDLAPGNIQIETDREVIDLTFQNQFHYLDNLLNQSLAERETVVVKRPVSTAPRNDTDDTAPSPPAAAKSEAPDDAAEPSEDR